MIKTKRNKLLVDNKLLLIGKNLNKIKDYYCYKQKFNIIVIVYLS